jgi:uncharacterized repeat protein (TIGR03803 family)
MRRIISALRKLSWGRAGAVFVLCTTTAIALPAQTFTTLYSFCPLYSCVDGANPQPRLVQATDGNLYGTTSSGGANNSGTVFKMTPSGALTTLYSFCSQSGCADGEQPIAGLVQGTDGNFYGTTYGGGASSSSGTVFEITPSGTLTTLHSFDGADGANPSAGLAQATNGDLYGTARYGGDYSYLYCPNGTGCGTVFKITPRGTFTTLHSFEGTDGSEPWAGLVQATDGDFYGTTAAGGANCIYGVLNACGTVFKITPSGTLTTLYGFCSQPYCPDGQIPYAGLVQATNGDLYGTTEAGGVYDAGTVFQITLSGTLTALHSFCSQSGCADGNGPYAGLVQATNGDLYGTTAYGPNGDGTVFEITPSGTVTTLHTFDGTDGANPYAELVQATNGDFYGAANNGGTTNFGAIFRLSVGLGPFVEARPTFAQVGAAITILGTDLAGATSVSFNGTAAALTVNSSGSAISTTVPVGASRGQVQVVTPGGTLSSRLDFVVLP